MPFIKYSKQFKIIPLNNPKYKFKICLSALFSVIIIIIIWQIFFIIRIPDVDTDAYVHHTIARQILLSPLDLSIHWVWLPMFHYLSAGAILLGANMDTIRFANIFIWALTPVLLFFFIYGQKKENNLFLAFVSSLLCTLFPIGILMGTTAQPEPLFNLLLLLFVITASKEKYFLSSILLTFACMLRYEAWAVLIVSFLLYLKDIKTDKNIISKKILNFLLPGIVILIWAVLRKPFDGKLFGFLFQTQQFVNDALSESNSFQGGFIKIIWDFIRYAVFIPVLFSGINLIFVPFGFSKCIKQNRWLVYSGLGILAFITISWMMKSNLGLNRHFVALIPLYSTLTAYGLLTVTEYLKRFSAKSGFLKKINIKYSLLIIAFVSCLVYLVMWLYIWNNNFKYVYTDKKSTSEYLKNIQDNKTIFCNDAIVEIFSNINFRRFNHVWMENNPDASDIILQTAKKEEYVYVVISEEKWKNIKNIGEVIYRSPINAERNTSILILKIK